MSCRAPSGGCCASCGRRCGRTRAAAPDDVAALDRALGALREPGRSRQRPARPARRRARCGRCGRRRPVREEPLARRAARDARRWTSRTSGRSATDAPAQTTAARRLAPGRDCGRRTASSRATSSSRSRTTTRWRCTRPTRTSRATRSTSAAVRSTSGSRRCATRSRSSPTTCRSSAARWASTSRQVVPVGFFPDRHLSASYREAIGTLYLSLHPSPMTMVEARDPRVSAQQAQRSPRERRRARERARASLRLAGATRSAPASRRSSRGARVRPGGASLRADDRAGRHRPRGPFPRRRAHESRGNVRRCSPNARPTPGAGRGCSTSWHDGTPTSRAGPVAATRQSTSARTLRTISSAGTNTG